jgi:hypothetical protein
MNMQHIALVSSELPIEMLARFAATLQVQIMRDFVPFWQLGASVSAVASLEDVEFGAWPIIISRRFSGPTEGFHVNPTGNLPTAYVRLDDSPRWTLTTSHEALEMLADPGCHRTFNAPSIDSRHRGEQVSYVVEVCDPVQNVPYTMENGALVSDFVTPSYYFAAPATMPFAGRAKLPGPLAVAPGGYLTYFDSAQQWFQARNNDGTVVIIDGPAGKGPPPNVCAREFAHDIEEFADRPRPVLTTEHAETQRIHAEANARARRRQAQRLLEGSVALRSWAHHADA